MTLVSQIISDAFRASNLTAVGKNPTDAQSTEALRYLNRIVKSVFGLELGEQLDTYPLGNGNTSQPSGYPGYDQTPYSNWIVPKNARLKLNMTADMNVYLHPAPNDGTRMSILDVGGNLSTHSLTVYGNGNLIEGSYDKVYNTDSLSVDLFYRADLGNWVRLTPLIATDVFPFPEEFDDFFIMLLAMRINPSYGKALTGEAQMIFNRAKNAFRSRYDQYIPVPSSLALARLGASNYYGDVGLGFDANTAFDTGRIA